MVVYGAFSSAVVVAGLWHQISGLSFAVFNTCMLSFAYYCHVACFVFTKMVRV